MQISTKRPSPEPRTHSAPRGAAAQCPTSVQDSALSCGAHSCSSPALNVALLPAPRSTASLRNIKCRLPECQKGNLNVKTFVKNNGGTIKEMYRFEVGEGMQKREENFAEEVAKQMNN